MWLRRFDKRQTSAFKENTVDWEGGGNAFFFSRAEINTKVPAGRCAVCAIIWLTAVSHLKIACACVDDESCICF